MGRDHYNTWTRIRAVLSSPSLYELASELDWQAPVGRPRDNPTYVVLTYGVLARVLRSGIRVELDLAEKHTWSAARVLMTEAISQHRLDLPPPGPRPPKWDHWRWMRNQRLTTDDGLASLARAFPPIAVAAARRIGQLEVYGPGSYTHPDPSRCVYGDGTLVRPLYKPPTAVLVEGDDGTRVVAYPNPRTGQLEATPAGRYDPDLLIHHGRGGPVHTHGYVCWHTRGSKPYQRIDLAAAHIPEPGTEANTAVELLRDVHHAAGAGIQAAIYDGALRGTHIDQIMRDYGYLVLAKQHTDAAGQAHADAAEAYRTAQMEAQLAEAEAGHLVALGGEIPLSLDGVSLVRTPGGRRARSYPLGIISHELPTGPCHHQIAAVAGHVVEIDLDDQGDPVVVTALTRKAVKRARRSTGQFHFNVGYELNCPAEPFTVWLSPHSSPGAQASRAEHLRVIPATDPDAQRLMGLRSDAEAFHSNFKRTLIVDRAMSLGWRRGLVDLYCFLLYNNALTEYRAAEADAPPSLRLRRF